jgi:hypothetical protein
MRPTFAKSVLQKINEHGKTSGLARLASIFLLDWAGKVPIYGWALRIPRFTHKVINKERMTIIITPEQTDEFLQNMAHRLVEMLADRGDLVGDHTIDELQKSLGVLPEDAARIEAEGPRWRNVVIEAVKKLTEVPTEGDIPQRKLLNARKAFAIPPSEDIFALYDDTVFGSNKEGLAFGIKGLYWAFEDPGFLPWSELSKCEFHRGFSGVIVLRPPAASPTIVPVLKGVARFIDGVEKVGKAAQKVHLAMENPLIAWRRAERVAFNCSKISSAVLQSLLTLLQEKRSGPEAGRRLVSLVSTPRSMCAPAPNTSLIEQGWSVAVSGDGNTAIVGGRKADEAARLAEEQRKAEAERREVAAKQYRQKVDECLADEVITVGERDTLDELQKSLGLLPEDATRIEVEAQLHGPWWRNIVIEAVKKLTEIPTEGDIPQHKLINARKAFAILPSEDIFALYDATVFGSNKEGLAFGIEGLYWREMWSKPKFLPWSELAKCEAPPLLMMLCSPLITLLQTRLCKLAADQGDADAQYNLGVHYGSGRGGLTKDERGPHASTSSPQIRDMQPRNTISGSTTAAALAA